MTCHGTSITFIKGTIAGGLRLKFRLKPDGVLFGWDIERPDGGLSRFDMPGGDFVETRY